MAAGRFCSGASSNCGEGSQAVEDLSCDWRAHCGAAGVGPRVPHHRFSDAPGLESAFFRGSPPLSGTVDDVTLRAIWRAVALAFALAMCVVRYWLDRLRGPMTLERRALWLQGAARAILRVLDIRSQVEGQPPVCGLVISNHLSYLDIIIISATMPCFFVAKMEIDGWPFFGKAARSGGTIFLDRKSLVSAAAAAGEISARLRLGVPVLLFPEGTSTDGGTVLRFYTRLFQPAIDAGSPVTAAAIRYVLNDGLDEREMCWFGDAGFLPHLWKELGMSEFSAQVRFGRPRVYADRKNAAAETRSEVVAMRQAWIGAAAPTDTVRA